MVNSHKKLKLVVEGVKVEHPFLVTDKVVLVHKEDLLSILLFFNVIERLDDEIYFNERKVLTYENEKEFLLWKTVL